MSHTHACPLCHDDEACEMACTLLEHTDSPKGSACVCSACIGKVDEQMFVLANIDVDTVSSTPWMEAVNKAIALVDWARRELPLHAEALRAVAIDVIDRRTHTRNANAYGWALPDRAPCTLEWARALLGGTS